MMEAIYTFFRLLGLTLGFPLQLLFFKRKLYFEDRSKTHIYKGGKLIITNHFNMFDYVLTSFIVYPRKLNVVTSEVPFRNKFFKFGMKFFGAIQANRVTRNMKFMDESADAIRKGQLVQIFPEGRNTPDGKMHEFKHSYIVIAHRAKAPIIPIVTDGNYGVFKRVSVMVGKEIDVSDFITSQKNTPTREELALVNEHIYAKMLELQKALEQEKSKRSRRKA